MASNSWPPSWLPTSVWQPVHSGLVSLGFAMQTALFTLLGAGMADGATSSLPVLAKYVGAHWLGALIGAILPVAYRAKQGYEASQKVVTVPPSPTPTTLAGP